VTNADIRDRRLPAELPVETLTAETGDFTSLSTDGLVLEDTSNQN